MRAGSIFFLLGLLVSAGGARAAQSSDGSLDFMTGYWRSLYMLSPAPIDPALLKKLARRFGPDIIDYGGRLKRKLLARRAFASDDSRDALNALVHPYLLRELRKQVRANEQAGRIVVIDAALLLDWDLDREIDATLVIHASREERIRRLVERGIDRADALARMKCQLPFAEYRRRASRLILNNKSPRLLQVKVAGFARKLV